MHDKHPVESAAGEDGQDRQPSRTGAGSAIARRYPALSQRLPVASPGGPTIHDAATAAVEGKGGGSTVDGEVAARVGSHLGADFSGVRVHDDPLSQEATQAMGARAFAHGNDVFLGPGQGGTDLGLMAHELTHVVQQGAAGRRTPQARVEVGDADSPAERQADQVAADVTGGRGRPSTLLVDDGPVGPGQMLKSTFIDQLRAAVSAAAAEELGPIASVAGCPYIDRYFARYAGRPAAEGETLLRRFAPTTATATTAAALIAPVVARVRAGVQHWRATGEAPPDLLAAEPAAAAAAAEDSADDADEPGGTAATDRPIGPDNAPPAATGAARTLAGLERELGPGQTLAPDVGARMSDALGADVSDARIHTGPAAARLADQHDATALTVGRNVVLAAGAYQPGSLEGDALLAHELAHVVQQAPAAASASAQRQPIAAESLAAEDTADQAAAGAVARLHRLGRDAGTRASTPTPTGLQLQRCSKKKQGGNKVATFAGAHDTPAGTVKHYSGSQVDAFLAGSKKLAPYIKGGAKATGKVFFYSSKDFVEAWVKYALTKTNPATGKTFTEPEARAWVPRAFTADDGGIHIDENAGEPRTAIHESMHFYQADKFTNLGWHISEGFTEYFAQELIKEQKIAGAGNNPALADPLTAATKLIAVAGFDAAAKAYFSGDIAALESAIDAAKGAGTWAKWKGYMTQNPPDFANANKLF